jgi:hypothetical protein
VLPWLAGAVPGWRQPAIALDPPTACVEGKREKAEKVSGSEKVSGLFL